jgi:glucose-1-phosphate cytidylyltransferase
MRINGGYFILRQEIFATLRRGEDLVTDAFQRLLPDGRLVAYRYDGFWQSMDTFKDKQRLDEMYAKGDAPWELWKRAGSLEDQSQVAAVPLQLPTERRRALRPR